MKMRTVLFIVVLGISHGACAEFATLDFSLTTGAPFSDYALEVQNVGATTWVDLDGSILQAVGMSLGMEGDWYLTSLNDSFTSGTLGNFENLYWDGPTDVGIGDFYLGVKYQLPSEDYIHAYGWVQLRNTGAELQYITDSGGGQTEGIVIGTQAIPEPATILLFGLGGFGAWILRKHICS